ALPRSYSGGQFVQPLLRYSLCECFPQQSFAQQFDDTILGNPCTSLKRPSMVAQKHPVAFDRFGKLEDAFVLYSDGADDWGLPSITPFRHFQERDQFTFSAVSAFAIGLVDGEDIPDLHNPGFYRLNIIPHPWNQYDDGNVGGLDDVHFIL